MICELGGDRQALFLAASQSDVTRDQPKGRVIYYGFFY